MKSFFKELLEYAYLTNQKLGDAFIDIPNRVYEKSLELYSHILNAHQIWNNRVQPKQTAFGVWQIHPMEDFTNINKVIYEHSLLILDKQRLNEIINYPITKGQPFRNSIQEIIFHTINHSTYHRAQIATEFSQNRITPLITDYIFYKG